MHEHSCVAAAICEKYIYGPDSLSLTRTTASLSPAVWVFCGVAKPLDGLRNRGALTEGWQRYLYERRPQLGISQTTDE